MLLPAGGCDLLTLIVNIELWLWKGKKNITLECTKYKLYKLPEMRWSEKDEVKWERRTPRLLSRTRELFVCLCYKTTPPWQKKTKNTCRFSLSLATAPSRLAPPYRNFTSKNNFPIATYLYCTTFTNSSPLIILIMAAAPGQSKYVTLVSCDGFEYVVLREAACTSSTIKRMLDINSSFAPPPPPPYQINLTLRIHMYCSCK